MKCAERIGGYLPSGKVLTMSLASLGVMSLALPNVMISLRENYDIIALLTLNEA